MKIFHARLMHPAEDLRARHDVSEMILLDNGYLWIREFTGLIRLVPAARVKHLFAAVLSA